MRRKRWRSLLKLRRAEERMKMRELARVLKDVASVRKRLREIESERVRVLMWRKAKKGESTPELEWLRGELLKALGDEERALLKNLETLELKAASKRSELVEAARKREAAETLYRKAEDEWKDRFARQDALETVEFVDRAAFKTAEM